MRERGDLQVNVFFFSLSNYFSTKEKIRIFLNLSYFISLRAVFESIFYRLEHYTRHLNKLLSDRDTFI